MFIDYLLKTEPSAYSFADLRRDKVTIWDGVTKSGCGETPPGDEARSEIDYLRNWRSQKRCRYRVGRLCRRRRSQESESKDQGRKSTSAAGLVGADQSQRAVRGFASGASRKTFRRATDRSTVPGLHGRVGESSWLSWFNLIVPALDSTTTARLSRRQPQRCWVLRLV